MPKKIDWRELAFALGEEDANELLDSKKSARVTKTNTSACTICTDPTRHAMKYQLLQCKSEACKAEYPHVQCGWRGKMLTCSMTRKMAVYESGNHFTDVKSPRRATLTRQQKAYCQELTAQRMKPVRVRNALRTKFGLCGDKLPRLRAIQNFVNYYSKTQLGYNDELDDIVKAVQDKAYKGGSNECCPISFTYGKTSEGDLLVGDRSDEEPFIVDITTKRLLNRLDRDSSAFTFHIDATFKLSQVGYPVLAIGISDRARKFHVVAFIVISTRIQSVYTMALLSFRAIYTEVTGKQIRLRFVMGDAEDGQFNALEEVFRNDSDFVFLMCFFHVMKKVQERTKNLSDRMANAVLAQIYDMHFCSTVSELTQTTELYLSQWSQYQELDVFATYFKSQWLSARYSKWQCCFLQPGFATTNNPVEQFNRVIKRGYTLRVRLKMGLLLKVLADCSTHESNELRVFNMTPVATAPLLRRAKQLGRDNLLNMGPPLFDTPYSDHVRVQSRPAPRIYIPMKKITVEYLAVTAQMGSNYARMEYAGQPNEGWLVNASAGWCQCRYWRKFGSCIHLLHARTASHRVNAQGKRILVNRSIVRRNGEDHALTGSTPAGRPILNRGPLSFQ